MQNLLLYETTTSLYHNISDTGVFASDAATNHHHNNNNNSIITTSPASTATTYRIASSSSSSSNIHATTSTIGTTITAAIVSTSESWSPWELVSATAARAMTTVATIVKSQIPANGNDGSHIRLISPLSNNDGGHDVASIGRNNMYSYSSNSPIRDSLNVEDAGGGGGGGGVGVANDILRNLLNITINSTTLSATAEGDTMDAAATETPYVPYVMRPETYIVPVLFALIFIVGVVGNGTLIVVFLSVRQMRNVPNTYILSLAVADLLVILLTVPLTSTVYTVDSWPWGDFLCTLSEFIKDVSIGVSVFTLTALSGDRYFAIVDPLRKFHAHGGGKRATRVTIAIAISIWILAMFCGLPALIGTYVKKIEINSNKSFSLCYPFPEQWGEPYSKTMVMLRFLVYYAIPLVIIGVFYVLIARHLMYTASVPGEMQGAVRQVRARRKVAVTVLAFVVIFGICFLPYHVFMLWFYFWPTAQDDYNSFWHVLRIVGFCLSFANSCANPVALYFVSGAFRKQFNRYLCCNKGGVIYRKRHNDTMCMHRDTSLTSTASKRYYSRRSCHHQSTIRSRLQETTITMMPNGNHNGNGDADGTNADTDYWQQQQRNKAQQQQLM